jgi:hypothetical protein
MPHHNIEFESWKSKFYASHMKSHLTVSHIMILQLVKCADEQCTHPLGPGPDVTTIATLLEPYEWVQIRQGRYERVKKPKEVGADANQVRICRYEGANGLFNAATRYRGASIPPSAKLTATMAVILTWQHHHPDEKIIGM